MPITPGEPTAAAADLNAALEDLDAALVTGVPSIPLPSPVLQQQAFSAFYHS